MPKIDFKGKQFISSHHYVLPFRELVVDKKKYSLSKDQIIKKFSNFNIETRSLWYPNHLQKPYKKFQNYEIKKVIKIDTLKKWEQCSLICSVPGSNR